jgi:hypothetical protein
MEARIALQGIELSKSGHNKFAGYKYFELGDFLPHIQTIFNKIGLCGVVSYNNEYASLCITDTDDSTVIVITSPMAEANLKGTHPIQNLGAVETYQRRYLWMTALEIVEHDILDASEPMKEAPKAAPAPAPKRELEFKKDEPAAKPAPAPKAEAPKSDRMKGWEIKVEADNEAAWAEIVVSATNLALQAAKSSEDVQSIFQVNRATFNEMKEKFPSMYEDLLATFKQAKESF